MWTPSQSRMIDPQGLMEATAEGRTVPITSFSVEEAVSNGTFRFAPPLIERSPRPTDLYLMWRSFQFVFEGILDPGLFPRLPGTPAPDDMRVLRRYIAAAEELAESELLCGNDGMTVRWRAEGNVTEV